MLFREKDPLREQSYQSSLKPGAMRVFLGLAAGCIIVLLALGLLLAACAPSSDGVLSAAEIQATVNAIVTASASPPSQGGTTIPFEVELLTGTDWEADVVRLDAHQDEIMGIDWNEDGSLVVHSAMGSYQLDLEQWGRWENAWSPVSHDNETIILSPDGQHHILIENHMWIIRKFDGNPIGLIGDIPQAVAWTSDGSKVVFAITNPNAELEPGIYSWPVDRHEPQLIRAEQNSTGQVVISPDGAKVAYLVNTGLESALTLRLVSIPGGEVENQHIDLPQGWQLDRWVTNDLLEFSQGLTSQSIVWYTVDSQTLYPIQSREAQALVSSPLPSPDGHWIAGQSIQINPAAAGEVTADRVESIYFVADLKTDENHNLAFGSESAIEYLTWSPDSRHLYLISCPTNESAEPSPGIPFGLILYEPESTNSNLLFGKVMQAALNPSRTWAYVAFPSIETSDRRVLTGALWEIGSEALIDRRVLLAPFIYRDPSSNGDRGPAIYFYARWSHDGQRLVVADPQGRLVLYDLDGESQVLNPDLFGQGQSWMKSMTELNAGGIEWSPDGHYLLIDFQGYFIVHLD